MTWWTDEVLGVTPSPLRLHDAPFGDRLLLAQVIGLDYAVGPNGEFERDDRGNQIPTGLLDVSYLDHTGGAQKVLCTIPLSGNSQFLGGLPEVGALCVVGFRQAMRPVVLCFLPFGLQNLVNRRSSIPYLTPGEILIQASTTIRDEQAEEHVLAGASVKLDRYGRILTEVPNYYQILGGVTDKSYAPVMNAQTEPVTNQPIFLEESFAKGSLVRRVDNQGNVVVRSLQKLYGFITGLVHLQTKARLEVVAHQGLVLVDADGNGLVVGTNDVDGLAGQVQLSAKKGPLELRSSANTRQVVGQNAARYVSNNDTAVIGGDRRDTVVGTWTDKSAGPRVIDSTFGVSIGGLANDALVRGDTYRAAEDAFFNAMSSALELLATALGNIPSGTLPSPAGAAPLGASITAAVAGVTAAKAQLTAFKAASATYLSLKHKVE
jgi:hypothetical protein